MHLTVSPLLKFYYGIRVLIDIDVILDDFVKFTGGEMKKNQGKNSRSSIYIPNI